MKHTNIIIGQSGGPTPVINMTLRGAVEEAYKTEKIDQIYGMRNGLEGLLGKGIISLHENMKAITKSSEQPGAILGGSRYSPSEKEFKEILQFLEEENIEIFCYIGGNGFSRTVAELHQRSVAAAKNIRFVHIPKTIDNDLSGTDRLEAYQLGKKAVRYALEGYSGGMVGLNQISNEPYQCTIQWTDLSKNAQIFRTLLSFAH